MSVATFSMKLDWKAIPLDLNTIEAWMKANAGPAYCGNQAVSDHLQLWFTEEPTQEIKDAIQAHWDSLDASSAEATNYKSAAQRKADEEAKAQAGKNKLKALGLTDEEIAALLG